MSLWRQVKHGVRVLFDRRAADADVADEVRDYVERSLAAHIARGLSPEEARRAAQREIGNATAARMQVRSYGWENAVASVVSDLRLALRRLANNPGFTIVSALTLALGIGASTAIFSAVYPILFAPLPYPDPERIATVWYTGRDGVSAMQSFGNFREVAARARSFEAIAAYKVWRPTMAGAAEPELLEGQQVSAAYFRSLGIRPAIGRDFDSTDDRLSGPNVAMISDALWRRRFAADSAVVGRQVTLNDKAYSVVGVLPRGFENVLSPGAQIWSLLQYDASLPPNGREWGHHLQVVARLKGGMTMAGARQELLQIGRNALPEFTRPPWSAMQDGMIVDPLRETVTREVKPALLAVVGAVSLLLLIASVNVASLLLARGSQRRGEFAMRVALGASRTRLMQQLITESVLLATIGGALGLLVADAGVRLLIALSPGGMPRAAQIGLHVPAYAFTLVASMVIGVAVGLAPALAGARHDLHAALQQVSRRSAGGHARTRRTLVAAEVALAVVLLVNAGLLLRSLQRLIAIPPGFDSSHVLTMQLQIASPARYPNDSDFTRFYARALDAVRAAPGVSAAAFTSELPLDGANISNDEYKVQIERAEDRGVADAAALRYAVTPGYFETMEIPLKRGRTFDEHDVAGAPVRPLVVSESFARRAFGSEDPLGRRIRLGGAPDRPWDVIVGVVGNVKQASLAASENDAVYANTAQWLWAETPLWLVVRGRGDAASLVPVVRRAIWSVDKDQPIVRVMTVDAMVAASESQRRFVLIVFETFALAALALASIGIYGVLAGSVSERLREIGVRAALGASSRDILLLVLRDGLTLTVLGVAVGLGTATLASRGLGTLLYGVSRLDPLTYVATIAMLGVVSALACLVPAARAAAVNPTITLRAE